MTSAPLRAGDRVLVVGDGRASYQWLGRTGTIIATTRYGPALFEVDVFVVKAR